MTIRMRIFWRQTYVSMEAKVQSCSLATLLVDWPGYLELCGVLNLIKIDSALIGQVIEHIACLLSFFTTLLEPADI